MNVLLSTFIIDTPIKIGRKKRIKRIREEKCEDYLRQVTNILHRITLTKLRLSNHKLAIETGRYVRPYNKPKERICSICKKKDVEDEIHFSTLFPCVSRKKVLYSNT